MGNARMGRGMRAHIHTAGTDLKRVACGLKIDASAQIISKFSDPGASPGAVFIFLMPHSAIRMVRVRS